MRDAGELRLTSDQDDCSVPIDEVPDAYVVDMRIVERALPVGAFVIS